MKTIAPFLFLMIVLFASCVNDVTTFKEKTDIRVANFGDISEYVLDSCEYIGYLGGASSVLSHKGNCKYCMQRQALLQENYIKAIIWLETRRKQEKEQQKEFIATGIMPPPMDYGDRPRKFSFSSLPIQASAFRSRKPDTTVVMRQLGNPFKCEKCKRRYDSLSLEYGY